MVLRRLNTLRSNDTVFWRSCDFDCLRILGNKAAHPSKTILDCLVFPDVVVFSGTTDVKHGV